MKDIAPEDYQRVLLRRKQENELFQPLEKRVAIRLSEQVASIDPAILPCDRLQLAEMARVIAVN